MRSSVRYSIRVKNHVSGERMKVELLGAPPADPTFRIRVNGRPAEKVPYAGKYTDLTLIRKWLVAH